MSLTILTRHEPWDVIVIGSGATGGWAAKDLSEQGLSVLVLEAGPNLGDAPYQGSALEHEAKRLFDRLYRRRLTQASHGAYWRLDPDLFVVDTDHPYTTPEGKRFDWIRTRAVNGRLLTWHGVGLRISDYELRAPEQDGFGEPWPLCYEDLAPHFDRIDEFFTVYGERDGLPQLPDGKYVSAPRLTEAECRFRSVLETHMPDRKIIASRGVLVRPSSRPNGEPPPRSPLSAALREPRVSLRADAVVSHLLVDSNGKATGVAFIDRLTKRAHEVSGRAIALCASTLESTRILLNSTSRHHPNGLGNSSGVLGHYLMDHPSVSIVGLAPGDRRARWDDGWGGPKNILLPRFHNLENRASETFLRGYGAFGGIGRIAAGGRHNHDMNEVPFGFAAYGEMLPRYENHVTLSRDKVDACGIPVLHIDCAFSDNESALLAHVVESMTEMVHVAGGRITEPPGYSPPGRFVHEMGTARMGMSAKTSVLNGYAQCWDVANVFVMDGAAWPSSAWQNPTFTMMAIAGRASAHLVHELKRGHLS